MERSRHHQVRAFGEKNYREATFRSLDERELHNLSEGPALLFIHGTNSLSHSDFHLLSREFLQAMSERYDGRVFAFDHPTLSVAPDANARWLAEFLPTGLGLELDIIAHSRGGLVARELAQRGKDNGLDGKLRVRSVTFVGTPNLGTPLCEPEHLGSYVDAMTNLLSVLPDNGITDAVDCVVGVLSHVARKAYAGVPGAMAMNPKGDYLKELNRQSLPSGCDFRIITSDFEPVSGSDWKRHLRDLVVDKVFRGKPNDLIVPTDADWEQDRVKTRLVLDKSKGIDHSSYWTDDQVLGALEPRRGEGRVPNRAPLAAPQVERGRTVRGDRSGTDNVRRAKSRRRRRRHADQRRSRARESGTRSVPDRGRPPPRAAARRRGGICRRPARRAVESPATARALSRGRGSVALPPAERDVAAEGSASSSVSGRRTR